MSEVKNIINFLKTNKQLLVKDNQDKELHYKDITLRNQKTEVSKERKKSNLCENEDTEDELQFHCEL